MNPRSKVDVLVGYDLWQVQWRRLDEPYEPFHHCQILFAANEGHARVLIIQQVAERTGEPSVLFTARVRPYHGQGNGSEEGWY